MVSFNRRIVRILEEGGHVDMQVLAEASQIAAKGEDSVTDYLIEKNILQERRTAGHPRQPAGCPADRPDAGRDPGGPQRGGFPVALAGETACVPISKIGGILTIAVSNPFDVVKHDDLRLATGCDLRLALALESQIDAGAEDLLRHRRSGTVPDPRRRRSRDADQGAGVRGRRRRRPGRGRRRRRSGPGHQAGEPHRLQRDQGEGVRHPHRAAREAGRRSATASTARSRRPWRRRSGSRTRWPAASRSWRGSTSPRSGGRRTASSR